MHHVARPTAASTKPGTGGRFPWSERFDRIFRNEEVTGSNPVSSTKALVRANFDLHRTLRRRNSAMAPRHSWCHRIERERASQDERYSW